MTVTAEARSTAQARLRWELLASLVRKDLKVKYKGSTLGFLWSLANPLLLLAVYYVVFQYVLRTAVPFFAVYLMAGLLAWNAFSTSVLYASGSVVGNANLVKKVRFPTTVLPLASVGYAAVHFVLQLCVFVVFLLVFYRDFLGPQLVLVVPALAVLLLFTIALSLLVSALTVRYRDVQHLLEVALVAWFWLNPVIYPLNLVRDRLGGLFWMYFLNPMAAVVATFQRVLYRHPTVEVDGRRVQVLADGGYAGYLGLLGISAAVALVTLGAGVVVFRRMQGDFAEEL